MNTCEAIVVNAVTISLRRKHNKYVYVCLIWVTCLNKVVFSLSGMPEYKEAH